jgi:putative addiction module component (TIGR02574 family)
MTLDELKSAALQLPRNDRAELAQFVLDSLDDQDEIAVRADWLALAARRMDEVRAGIVVGIPAEQVLSELRSMGGRNSI